MTFADRAFKPIKCNLICNASIGKQMKLILKCIYLLADWVLLNRLSFAPRPTRPYWHQYSDRDDKCMPLLLLVFCFFFSLTRRHRVCLEFIFTRTYGAARSVTYTNANTKAHDEIRTLSPPLFIRKPRVRIVRVTLLLLRST